MRVSPLFTLHIRSLKEATLTKEGKTDTLKTFTVDSPIPFLMTDLLDMLKDDDTRKGVGKTGPVKGVDEPRKENAFYDYL